MLADIHKPAFILVVESQNEFVKMGARRVRQRLIEVRVFLVPCRVGVQAFGGKVVFGLEVEAWAKRER